MTAVPATASTLLHARWDGRRVLFEVQHEGADLSCAISPDALRDLSASRCFKPADLLRVLAAHRIPVETIVLNKLRMRRSAGPGPLMLWSGDIEEFGPAGSACPDPLLTP